MSSLPAHSQAPIRAKFTLAGSSLPAACTAGHIFVQKGSPLALGENDVQASKQALSSPCLLHKGVCVFRLPGRGRGLPRKNAFLTNSSVRSLIHLPVPSDCCPGFLQYEHWCLRDGWGTSFWFSDFRRSYASAVWAYVEGDSARRYETQENILDISIFSFHSNFQMSVEQVLFRAYE